MPPATQVVVTQASHVDAGCAKREVGLGREHTGPGRPSDRDEAPPPRVVARPASSSARPAPGQQRLDPRSLQCNKCKGVLRNAVGSNCCGAEFCEVCARALSDSHAPCGFCGAERAAGGSGCALPHFTPLRSTRECVGNLETECDLGCGARMQRKALAAHRADCPLALHPCPGSGAAMGCPWKGLASAVDAHKDACLFHKLSGLGSWVDAELGSVRERQGQVDRVVRAAQARSRVLRMTTHFQRRKLHAQRVHQNELDLAGPQQPSLGDKGDQGDHNHNQGEPVAVVELLVQEGRSANCVWKFQLRTSTLVGKVALQAEARRHSKFALSFGAPLALGGLLLDPESSFHDLGFTAADFTAPDGPVRLLRVMGQLVSTPLPSPPPNLPPLPQREWVHAAARAQPGSEGDGGRRPIRVCSYNVLAPTYASHSMYPYTPASALEWGTTRRWVVVREIEAADADVVCLQEVEVRDYHDFFSVVLKAKGYRGHFARKLRSPDGCAVFWRDSVFSLRSPPHTLVLGELAAAASDGLACNRLGPVWWFWRQVTQQRNVAHVVALRRRDDGRDVWVCNTHLHWDPTVPEVKAAQMAVVLRFLEQRAGEHARAAGGRKPALVVCGDTNSLPRKTESDRFDHIAPGDVLVSGVYELAVGGALPASHPHHPLSRLNLRKEWEGQDAGKQREGEAALEACLGMRHTLGLKSAYAEVLGEEPPWTNYTAQFKGTLDYVFYSSASLRAVGCLAIPPEQVLSKETALPNSQFPSDHLSIVADLELLPEHQ